MGRRRTDRSSPTPSARASEAVLPPEVADAAPAYTAVARGDTRRGPGEVRAASGEGRDEVVGTRARAAAEPVGAKPPRRGGTKKRSSRRGARSSHAAQTSREPPPAEPPGLAAESAPAEPGPGASVDDRAEVVGPGEPAPELVEAVETKPSRRGGTKKRGSRRRGARSSDAAQTASAPAPAAPAAAIACPVETATVASGAAADEIVDLDELTDVAELAEVKALVERGRAVGVLAYDRILVIGAAERPAPDHGAPVLGPAFGCLARIEQVLLPRRVPERNEAGATGEPVALAADPTVACLRRIAAVLHPGAAGGEEAAPGPAPGCDEPGGSGEPVVACDAAGSAPAVVRMAEAATAAEANPADGPPSRAHVPAQDVQPPARALAAGAPHGAQAARETPPGSRQSGGVSTAIAPRFQTEVDPRRTERRGRGNETVRAREFALPAVAILAFTGAMLGGVVLLTRDGASDPARPTSMAAAGAQQANAPRLSSAEFAPAGTVTRSAAPAVSDHPAAPHLAQAAALAEANREDAMNSSLQGARNAEAEALEAFRLGGSDLPGAWRVLADVYFANRDWSPHSAGRAEYRRKERDALARALEETPGDGEARFRYAMLLEDRNERVKQLARAVRDNPSAFEPKRSLGEDLILAGNLEEGARILVETMQHASRRELNIHGRRIATLLQGHGRAPDAAEVRASMQQARQ